MEGESREMLKIGDIYAGKPDAGDEIKECGYEEFANIFIHPTGVNIGRLASTKYGTPFFIINRFVESKQLHKIMQGQLQRFLLLLRRGWSEPEDQEYRHQRLPHVRRRWE